MCEPCHSIVQYATDGGFGDDDRPIFGDHIDPEIRIKTALGTMADWGKKVLRWFHFSKLGSGHTSMSPLMGARSLMLPRETKYEGEWWYRRVKFDGFFSGHHMDRDEALQAATIYSDEVVLGSMSKFRRFLDTSIMKSQRGGSYYVDRLLEYVFNVQGRNVVCKKLQESFSFRRVTSAVTGLFNAPVDSPMKRQAVDCLLGFTRKRDLFVPGWADVDSLWVPSRVLK